MELAAFAYMSCMKRRILTATIIAAMAIATQQAVAGSLVEVELAKASGSKTPNTLTLKTDVGVVRTFLEITQDESKRIELKAPPFASIDVSGVLYIGELTAKGLFALMLDSFNGPIPYKGFGKNGNISILSNLSLAPKLSGMALCAENLDVVALNPVFNPNSPLGFGFVMGNERAFVSFLTASQNSVLMLKTAPKLQVDWKYLGYGRHMFFSMVGTSFKGNVSSLGVEGSFFLQNAWDLLLGGGTSVGMGAKLELGDMKVEFDRRLGGVGVTLRTLYEEHRPIEELSISCKLGTSFEISCKYSSTTFAAPLYGGRSQERTERFGTSLRHRGLSVEVEGNLLFESDRGRRSYTDIGIGFKGIAGEDADIGLQTRIERSQGRMQSIGDTTLTFSCGHAKLKAKGDEVALEYSYSVPLTCDRTLAVSVNQDRTVTLRLSLGGT